MRLFPTQVWPRTLAGRVAVGHPRLIASLAAALAGYLLLPLPAASATRLLLAWNVGAWLYIALTLAMMAASDERAIRWRARITDEGQFVILLLCSLGALTSLAAIVAELGVTKDMKGLEKGWHLGLAGATILSAWIFVHVTYALHYAHEYFDRAKGEGGEPAEVRGGISFPGTEEPDYWDFLYFSFIIGVAAQTADIAITAKAIRRASLVHSILAFVFNSAILALTINIAAGLI